MNDIEQRNGTDGPAIIGDGSAGRELYAYIYDHFGGHAFTRDETTDYSMITDVQGWEWIRAFMERLLAMDDLERAVTVDNARHADRLFQYCGCGGDDERAVPRVLNPPSICWTWLEAAYERLGDADGLRRLYSYRIITSRDDGRIGTEESNRAVRRLIRSLRELAGDEWSDCVRRIVDLQQRYHGDPMVHGRNPAYEMLLKQERLGEAAWEYCRSRNRDLRADAVIDELFAVMAESDAEQACALLLEPLHDADSPLMRADTQEHIERICTVLRRLADSLGPDRMRTETDLLLRRYRRRKALREALERLLREYDGRQMVNMNER
ncbi:hypothetical protein [Bifidobacterium saguinibicoloris]|uniref:hypothetical protein n=1 Tax=Bifidobacterium saguinibicoloris TaxID=2834433 RepID=UPI001C57CA44|nr:hypothetical protein [Bifidobacterium saguinibicoloris]MBW3080843.1 hypothetical protein [Bifidobacterium saguinibicoloris]